MKYLLDTNTVIYFMDGALTHGGYLFLLDALQNQESALSVISEIEVLGFRFSDTSLEVKMERFVQSLTIYPLSNEIVKKTIEIRKLRKIKVADAIIAASAIFYGLTLVSRNVEDFKNLPGLTVLNPFDL